MRWGSLPIYVDFELEIERSGERYRARVLKSSAGSGASCELSLPEELASDPEQPGPFRGWRHLRILVERSKTVQDIGSELFQAVFAGSVWDCWRDSLVDARARELRLRLKLRLGDDPRVLSVPWELLRQAHEFLAFDHPIIRILAVPMGLRSLPVKPPVRVLALFSCPPGADSLEIDQEWLRLEQALTRRRSQVVLDRLVQPTLQQIDDYLRNNECHVLHFGGHGLLGSLVLAGVDGGARSVDQERLGRFLRHKSLRLVVLNACQGARTASDDVFSGVAQALVRGGVPAVVAMQEDVEDRVSISFTQYFYEALARGETVAESLAEARLKLWRDGVETVWANPVLYLNAEDAPLLPPPSHVFILMIILGLVIASWLGLLLSNSPEDVSPRPLIQPPSGPYPPRIAELNPKECPSPGDLNIAFERIEPGSFQRNDKEAREVRVAKPFCLGTYEVTRELWSRVREEPPPPEEARYFPIQGVTYDEAEQFMVRLNKLDPAGHYRFPTEEEWELAARAGTRTRYHFGDDEAILPLYGNCLGKDRFTEAAPVGQLKPNDLGLYDMYGNAFEWVADPQPGGKRVRRGGSWSSSPKKCTSVARSEIERRDKENGFRIVRAIR